MVPYRFKPKVRPLIDRVAIFQSLIIVMGFSVYNRVPCALFFLDVIY